MIHSATGRAVNRCSTRPLQAAWTSRLEEFVHHLLVPLMQIFLTLKMETLKEEKRPFYGIGGINLFV